MIKRLVLILLFLGLCFNAKAGIKTWQNGGVDNNWSTAGNWVEGSKPAAGDDVIMAANYNCAVNEATAALNSFNQTGYAAILSGSSNITVTVASGTVTCLFANGASHTWSGTLNLNPAAGTTINLTMGGMTTCGGITIAGTTTGQVVCQDTCTSVGAVTLTSGTLDTNDKTCSWNRFVCTSSTTRTLDLGASAVTTTLSSSGSSISWNCANSSSFTLIAGTSSITILASGSSSRATFIGCGKTYATVTLTGGLGTDYPRITDSNTFGTLNLIGTAIKTHQFKMEANQTVTGTLNINGNSSVNRFLLTSDTLGTARTITITGATISGCSNVDFRDITFADNKVGNTDFSAITGGSGDCGGNSRTLGTGTLVLTTADDWYWQTTGAGTYNWSDATYWFTATNGGGDSGDVRGFPPLPQDNCYFDADSVTGATTVNLDMPRLCKTLDFTSVDAITIDNITTAYKNPSIFGSLIVVNNVTWNSSPYESWINFYGRGAFTLNSSVPLPGFALYMIGGTLTLASDYYSKASRESALLIVNGTFDADIYNVDMATNGQGAFNISGTTTRGLRMGSGTWTLQNYSTSSSEWTRKYWYATTTNNLTFDAESSTISLNRVADSAYDSYFNGGGLTYNNLTIVGGGSEIVVFTGSNTFNTLIINAPKTVKFTDGTTTTVSSFVATGDASNAITITGTNTTGWTISDSAGENRVYYCTISNSTATGGATWLAYTSNGNVDGGNNSGWKFTAPSGSAITIF